VRGIADENQGRKTGFMEDSVRQSEGVSPEVCLRLGKAIICG
jgi:hypothetical protein